MLAFVFNLYDSNL